jgi:hypothetical protein
VSRKLYHTGCDSNRSFAGPSISSSLSGNRDLDGKYARFEAHGFYWSATEQSGGEAWFLNFGKGS